jgi:hypothetical protein
MQQDTTPSHRLFPFEEPEHDQEHEHEIIPLVLLLALAILLVLDYCPPRRNGASAR